jgi:methionine aminopeptidase
MVELKTNAEIDAMAAAGAVVAEALRAVVEHAKPGQTTAELDKVAADVLARSPFLNYHPRWAPSPFPAVLCVSVNDAVVHGIPNGEVLAGGDLVSVGRTMHEDPHVPNEGRPGKGMRLRPGLVIAIEPMSPRKLGAQIADGTDEHTHDSDGWTLRTASGRARRAQRAHCRGHRRRAPDPHELACAGSYFAASTSSRNPRRR